MVCAEVCQQCGEQLYSKKAVAKPEDIRKKPEDDEAENFEHPGESFRVTA